MGRKKMPEYLRVKVEDESGNDWGEYRIERKIYSCKTAAFYAGAKVKNKKNVKIGLSAVVVSEVK